MNPKNIRYLSPKDVPFINSATSSSLELAVGLSAANLMCSVGTLAISAYTAHQISVLHKKVDLLQMQLNRIEGKIDRILELVKRIDTKVSENNLRHALTHITRKAVSIEGVNLAIFLNLKGDLQSFVESLESPLEFNFSIRLSSDVRDQLSAICELLFCVRKLVARCHNIAIEGNPELAVTFKPCRDYFYNEGLSRIVEDAILHDNIFKAIFNTTQLIEQDIRQRFWLSSDQDAQHYQELMNKNLKNPLFNAFIEGKKYGLILSTALPEKIFENQDYGKKYDEIYDLCLGWLYKSDAGLIHKTLVELSALEIGYDNAMWHHLPDDAKSQFDNIMIDCELPTLEAV